ncbi:MAG: YkgJ family cysteine cluster protein [Pseudanabaenaceae cyanobacterium]
MAKWRCIPQCGACCHLDPSDRPDLEDYLTPAELQQYLGMVGADGWCIHFDHSHRQCRIYAERPDFCRVSPQHFQRRYGVPPKEFDNFANECCIQQIGAVYGNNSAAMKRFRTATSLSLTPKPNGSGRPK